MGLHSETNNKEVQVYHTKRGVLYTDPKQLLRSKNAKMQIKALKKSDLLKEIRDRQPNK